jgi:hypothetical protein
MKAALKQRLFISIMIRLGELNNKQALLRIRAVWDFSVQTKELEISDHDFIRDIFCVVSPGRIL